MKSLSRRATIRFLKAYLTTLSILIAYGWFFFRARLFGNEWRDERIDGLHRTAAKKIEKTILSLQGLFIKIGQLFSIMTNFLPTTFREGLQNLQDAVPARPYAAIAHQIQQEFGAAPEELFARFDPVPIASASLGQVHCAMTHEGQKVAVKIRHADVEVVSRADLRTIWRILQLVKRFVSVRGLDNYYYEISAMIQEELDFEKEARNIETISGFFTDRSEIGFPFVVKELSGKKVLTQQFVEGIKITDVDRLREAGIDPTQVATILLTSYCQMIFVDGTYHADPHPGNILVQPDGRIMLLDFGAVGVLREETRTGLGTMMEAIIKADEEQLLGALKQMGFLRIASDQTEAASRVIEHFHRKFQEEIRLKDFSFSSIQMDAARGLEHLADLREMNVGIRELSSAFHMPREWVLLERTVLQLTGICAVLDSGLNPAAIVRPYLEEFVLGKDTDWSEVLFDVTREKAMSFLSLPKVLERFVGHAVSGRLRIRTDGYRETGKLLYLGLQQLTFAVLCGTAAAAAMYLDHTGRTAWSEIAIRVSGGSLFLLVVTILRAGRQRQ
jgi:ubiquinone biosynthesis protein